MVHVKALQERCLVREETVTCVRKHNATLMNEQGQYKDVMRTFNKEVKELREKLVEAEAPGGGDGFARESSDGWD